MAFPKRRAFWDMIFSASPALRTDEEINSCFLCTGSFIGNLLEAASYDIDTPGRKTTLCEKCERDISFPLSAFRGNRNRNNVRDTDSFSWNENMIKEITFNDYEAKFFERYFFQYGVEKAEVKSFFQNASVRSYVGELNELFCQLQHHGGDPDTFATDFFESGDRPPTTSLNEFRKCLKLCVKKHEEASCRQVNNSDDSE